MNETIQNIMNSKAIAVVGVSDKKFGGVIYKTLKKRGYTVYPIHPTKQKFDNDFCYNTLDQRPPEVDSAVLAISPDSAKEVLNSLQSTSLKYIWFQQGKDFSKIEKTAQDMGIQTVSGKCILMYANPVDGIHAVHRFFSKLFGKY